MKVFKDNTMLLTLVIIISNVGKGIILQELS